jgi:hypothetical protein
LLQIITKIYAAGAASTPKKQYDEVSKNQNNAKEDESLFMKFKNIIGTTTDPKLGITNVPPSQRSFLTWTRHLLERNLRVITFAATPIVLFDHLKPILSDWGKETYNWFSSKLAYVASFLRGGPVKRQMDL